MAWIETVPDESAEGKLAAMYEAARQRAGGVFNVVRVQSLNPATMRTGLAHYREVMFGDSPLSRAQREMIAVVVSRANDCFY
jgi:uncharacterized peroxidase-related enzyme